MALRLPARRAPTPGKHERELRGCLMACWAGPQRKQGLMAEGVGPWTVAAAPGLAGKCPLSSQLKLLSEHSRPAVWFLTSPQTSLKPEFPACGGRG